MDFLQKEVTVGDKKLKLPAFVTLVLGIAAAMGASYRGTNMVALYFLVLGLANAMTLTCVLDGDCKIWGLVIFVGNVILFGSGILAEIKLA